MWIEPVVMSGRLIRLEPLEGRHAPALLSAADPELFRFTPQAPAEWSVPGFVEQINKLRARADVMPFAVVLNESGTAIGRTTFMDIQAEHRGVEIGRTWLGRAHHATPVNPEMKFLMLRHAFERLAPTAARVQLTTAGTNLHSQRAIAKLGAVREGVLRSNRVVPSGPSPSDPPMWRDTVVYSILPAEWPTVRAGLLGRLGWQIEP
ncbi:MAG: GNAT family protein [Phycisphaerales bacterium]|nr:GNAT family protein [Phycisphaerales bacterium]